MKPNPLAKLFPSVPWAGDRTLLADWDNNCIRDRGWPFLTISQASVPYTIVTFLDEDGQTWTGISMRDFPGILKCRLSGRDKNG